MSINNAIFNRSRSKFKNHDLWIPMAVAMNTDVILRSARSKTEQQHFFIGRCCFFFIFIVIIGAVVCRFFLLLRRSSKAARDGKNKNERKRNEQKANFRIVNPFCLIANSTWVVHSAKSKSARHNKQQAYYISLLNGLYAIYTFTVLYILVTDKQRAIATTTTTASSATMTITRHTA